MVYGYARCSTNETKQDVNRQKRELKAMGAEEIYLEYESGIKLNRPELSKVLRQLKSGDTLVCTEISRITRSTKQLCEIIEFAVNNQIKLVLGTFTADCTNGIDAMTEGMVKMMGVFAEMERNMTIERIRSGLENARSRGVKLGRPPKTIKDIPRKVLDYFPMYQEGIMNISDYAKVCGVTRPTIYKYIRLMTD